MTAYFCLINTPGVRVREIVAVTARSDAEAVFALDRIGADWPGYETLTLYDGERLVEVRANASLGFAAEPLVWARSAG